MRIAFFNERDSFALTNNLNSKSIIDGMSYDDRIGHGYNNPSFDIEILSSKKILNNLLQIMKMFLKD